MSLSTNIVDAVSSIASSDEGFFNVVCDHIYKPRPPPTNSTPKPMPSPSIRASLSQDHFYIQNDAVNDLPKVETPQINMFNNSREGNRLIREIYRKEALGQDPHSPNPKMMPFRLLACIFEFSSNSQRFTVLDKEYHFLSLNKKELLEHPIVEEYMSEWIISHLGGIPETNPTYEDRTFTAYLDEDGDKVSCACSHTIHDLCYIQNIKNGNVLRIGDDCINKFGNTDMKRFINHVYDELNVTKCKKCSRFRQRRTDCYFCSIEQCPSCKAIKNKELPCHVCKTCDKCGQLYVRQNIVCQNCLKRSLTVPLERDRKLDFSGIKIY